MSEKVYLRGKTWWARFTHPKTGERIRFSCQTSDKTLAIEYADRKKAEAWRETVFKEKPKRQWIEAAIRWIEERSIKKRSISDDARKLDLLNPIMGQVLLDEINNDFVREKVVRGFLMKRNLKPATINRYVTLIKSILNIAMKEWEWIDQVPYLSKPGSSGERQRKQWLSPDQFKRFVGNGELQTHIEAVCYVALCTGMRFSNVAQLRWAQVNMASRSIFIPKEVFKGKRDHYVPMCDTVMRVIRNQIGNHPVNVFTFRGEPFKSINLRFLQKRLEKLGIYAELRESGLLLEDEDFVIHGLRHTFATWHARTGTPLEIIEAIGGWKGEKNVRIATNYTHISDVTHLLPYAKKIDLILSGELQVPGTNLAHDSRTNLAQTL
jgi:integrase